MRNRGLLRFVFIFLLHIFIYKSTCNNFDVCSTNPCHSNGYCISYENGGFHCRCSQGWTGDDCSVDVDECHLSSTNPCEHNGVCINSPGGYQCLCSPGYHGSRCEDEILECALNPCKHDGTCIDLINGFQCVCPLGYEGLTCEDEVNECSSSPCKNGAQCEDLINNYTCHCLPGWTGLHCENPVRPCAANSSLCLNNATCLDLMTTNENIEMINESNDLFVCLCPEAITTTTFNNNGNSSTFCHCKPGFSGHYCENVQDYCQHSPCHNGGICMLQNSSNNNNTINHMNVVTAESNYNCMCQPGYSGKHCEINIYDCFNQPCGSYGICKDEIDGYHCECLKGWEGLHCNYCDIDVNECLESEEKQSSLCQNGGQCINTYGSYICSCTTEYYGKHCEHSFNPCSFDNKSICFNGGICSPTSDGIGTLCLCPKGFTGPQCREQLNECTGQHSCMNDGICLDVIGNYHCLCPVGRHGMNCEFTSKQICTNQSCSENVNVRNCTTNLCLNGGSCINFYTTDNSSVRTDNHNKYLHIPEQNNLLESQLPHCSCPFGYIGEYCQIELDFCQLFHYIKHYFNYFKQPEEIEDYFRKNLTISSYLINDWLISSSLSSIYHSWYEINSLYSTFIINYTFSRLLSDTSIRKILSTGNLFINNSLVDIKSTLSNSTLFMITSPMGLCDPIGSSQCVPLLSSVGDSLRSDSSGFTCICHVDYEGRYCEKYVDFCDKMNKQYNGENCSESSCQDFYITKTMECNQNDESNCTLNDDLKNITFSTNLPVIYDNNNNTTNMSSSTGHYTNHIVPGSLVLLINSTPEELITTHPEKLSLLTLLNKILHLEVEIEHHPKTELNTKSVEIRSRYSRHVNMKSSLSNKQLLIDQNEQKKKIYQKESMGSQVYLKLNSKKCYETGGPCFHNVDFAAQFLTAYMHTRNHNLLQTILTVQSVRPDTSSTSLFEEEKRSRYRIMDISIGRLGQKMIKKVLKAKIWYPSPGLVRNSRIVHNSPNNYNKPSKFTDDPTKYLSLKLPTLEQQSITTTTTTTSCDEQINDVNIKNKSVSELEKCLDMLQGRAYDTTLSCTMTIDNKNSTSLTPSSPTSRNQYDVNKTFSDFGYMNTKFTPNHIPSTLIKYTTTHTFTMPISCISQNYSSNLSSLSSTEHQQNQRQHYSFMPVLESTEYDHSGSPSNSTITTAINMNRTNNFNDFDCQQSENSNSFNNNSNNFQTMQELCQFLNSITQSELNSFQKILLKTILDYYGSGDLLEMNSYERYQQKQQQRLCTTFARSQNPALNSESNISDFNIVCHLLTQNDESNTMQTILHNSMNSVISWQMIYNSTHLHRLLNLRIPDTGETLLHISARFNQDKAIYNLLNVGADFSTVDNQGRTALYTAVSVSAIESVQAILSHPTSGLSPFYIFNMLLHAMNVLVCALTKTNISRGQEYTSYDMIGTSTDLLHIQSTSSSLSTGAVASLSPPTTTTTPTVNGGVEFNYEENTLNFLDINTSDSLGRTALHWAAVTDQSDIIHSLCNSGATVDAQTLHEETPLALACREGAVKSCRLLLLSGANLNLADYLDRTPRDLAYLGGHYEIVNLLDEYTANSNTEYCTSGNLNKTRKHDLFTSKTLTTDTNTLSTLPRITSIEQSYCSYFPTPKLYDNNNQHQLTYYDTESITHKLSTGNPASQHYSMMKSAVKDMNEECPKSRSVHCIMTTTTTTTTISTIGVATATTSPKFIETYGLTTTVATSSSSMFNNKFDLLSASQYSLGSELTTKLITTNDVTTTNNNDNNNNTKRTPPSLALLNTNTNNIDNNNTNNTILNSIQTHQTFNKPDNLDSFTNNTNNNTNSNDVKVELLKDSLLKVDYNFNNKISNSTHINHIITNSNIMGSDESESPNHWSSSSSDLSPNRTNMNNIILQKFDEQPSIYRGIHHPLNTSNLSSIMLSKCKSCINVNNYPHYNKIITNCNFINPNINNTTYNKESFLTNYNNQYHFDDYNNNNHQQQYQRQYHSTDRQS
ncbi:notch [Schistosoma mansoni]|uniref:notch n=1 Tax=Schistosoma mansoni TaxID=6183 RepID=UPI00022DC882|nr:notch [Schistosoma mansoni]|eukprot:XP_018648078.1 notch [Schistosoma mansoni]